jgi:hypothetical protein
VKVIMEMSRLVHRLCVIGLFTVPLLVPPAAVAQNDLEKVLEQQGRETVIGYIQPAADLFGASMNSGFFGAASATRSGLSFALELVAIGALVRDAQRTYTAATPTGYTPQQVETATLFGGQGATVSSQFSSALTYRFSDGLIDASIVPYPAAQLRVGGIAGTQAVVRYIPEIALGDQEEIPSVKLFGIGVAHSISQYLGPLPAEIAGLFSYTTFQLGDYIDVQGIVVGGQASRTLSVLTLFGGASWERTQLDLSYTSTAPDSEGEIHERMNGANGFRVNAGAALRFGPITLFGDAGLGHVTTVAAGLRLGN